MKILIVDDHSIVRIGLRKLIENDFAEAQVFEADSLQSAVQQFTAEPPDVVLLDLNLPDVSGIEGVTRMVRVAQDVPVIVLSLNDESAYATRVLQLGASGYLPKTLAAEELSTAIQRIRQGRRYITSEMAERLVGLLDGKPHAQAPHERLSQQEHRVMLLTALGKSTAQIGELMHLSAKTVSTYRARILQKTGWQNTMELTRYCVENGLAQTA